MASIVPGFEYDIFISYRHNDNLDGWVTQFVENLEKELRGTLKETLTIYFDKNPHDGLQQHHEVDDSLKEKLKSLILIPIISQTYCDPKAFAWSHELIPFIRQASEDTLGLKTRVSGGNIASRVLPVKIHDIDNRDKLLFEQATGSVMRSIDFIYKESGVNRPLRHSDDRNQNEQRTDYRNQVNKVANAIKEIIAGLRPEDKGLASGETIGAVSEPAMVPKGIKPKRKWQFNNGFAKSLLRFNLPLIGALLALLVLAYIHFSERPPESRIYRTIIPAPEKTTLSSKSGGHLALSPDGRMLAFVVQDSVGKQFLYVRQLHELTARKLPDTEDAAFPFWSPDSRYIGFFTSRKLKKFDFHGGSTVELCDALGGRGGTWSKNGTIIFNAGGGRRPLRIIMTTAGSKAKDFSRLDTIRDYSHRWPHFLPDGQHFLYTRRISTGVDGNVTYLASLDTTRVPKPLLEGSSCVQYANGHLLYLVGRTLMAQPFDTHEMQLKGEPIPIAERVYYEITTGKPSFTVSNNGTLAYETAYGEGISLNLFDRTGSQVGTIPSAGIPHEYRFSPDESRIALSMLDIKTDNIDIWLHEIPRKVSTRFTFDPGSERVPTWSPDGQSIIFTSNRSQPGDFFKRASNGEGPEELLTPTNRFVFGLDWSQDGKFIAYSVAENEGSDIEIMTLHPSAPNQEPTKSIFLHTKFNERSPAFSPDGRWIAYHSDESGTNEVYIRPFPGPGGKWQVSVNGGTRPKWRKDGKELFFLAGTLDKLMTAEVNLGATTISVHRTRTLQHAAHP